MTEQKAQGQTIGLPPGGVDYLARIAQGTVGKGLSSKALALYALGMNDDLRDAFGSHAEPRDPSDLRRCYLDYEQAPMFVQIITKPVLEWWTRVVFDRYPNPQGTEDEVAAYMEQARRIGALEGAEQRG